MKRYPYPKLAEELLALGSTRLERAARLDVDPKTVDRLLQRLPRDLKPFKHAPQLLRALADDLEAANQLVP